MSWGWLLAACATAYVVKLAGFLVPLRVVENPRALHVAGAVTVGLLAALTATNTVADGTDLALDSRLLALGVAAAALALRVPFLGVVLLGVGVAALARALGLP
ncbi:hypothetical protein GCM10011519_18920 [Marmoricola endophyticus]|uniref:AzlD domain-containing protein n=1 Tax=Marmoricola endophyticus TaxID=2040280 RepID=A0A917BKC7_9ACTN|nr:AzlD domain-containing protein [Marmoricola endophyticus]GGF45273.1 hypothetical protein GCM10011519_18920 [Marmoricola endophyticus]